MRRSSIVSIAMLASALQMAGAQDAGNSNQTLKNPTIPDQQQSGSKSPYSALQGTLKKADVKQGAEGVEIAFRDKALFDPGSTTIRDEAREDLNKVASAIAEQPTTAKVKVNGRADSSKAADPSLSDQRAEAVSSYLIAQGVPEECIVQKSSTGRQTNRRADIILLN